MAVHALKSAYTQSRSPSRKHYLAHRTELLIKQKQRYKANPDYFHKASRRHYLRNRDQLIKQSVRRRRALSPFQRAKIYQRYARKYPDRIAAKYALRRARKAVTIEAKHFVEKVYARARQWRNWGFDVVVDHIIPLAKGGFHIASNLQIIYRKENCEKGARLDYVSSVVFL